MSDEDSLSQASAKAARAQALLGNELLAEAFQGLEDAYIAKWRSSTIEDVGAREKLFLAINIVGKVRDHLHNIVSNGSVSAAELKILTETAERKRRFGTLT